MKKADNLNNRIHAVSVILGSLFAESYSANKKSERTQNLLDAFRAVRRSLPVVATDKKGRELHMGHDEAYLATQG